MYFDVFAFKYMYFLLFPFICGVKGKGRKYQRTKRKNTRPKKQPLCPFGHKIKLMLQALACTLTLTIAAKLHVRDVWFVSKLKFTPTTTLLFYYQAMPDLQSFYSVVLAKATQLDSA